MNQVAEGHGHPLVILITTCILGKTLVLVWMKPIKM
jgi:hypothetical protein